MRQNFYSSKKVTQSPPIASPSRSRAAQPASAHRPSPCFNDSSPSHSPSPLSLTPPQRQPQLRPSDGTQGAPRRKSLSMAADRIQKEKLKQLLGSLDIEEDEDDDGSHSDVRKMWNHRPERRCRSNSSDSRSPSVARQVSSRSTPALLGEISPSSGWLQLGMKAAPRFQVRQRGCKSLQVCGSEGADGCDRHSMGVDLCSQLQAEVARRRSLSVARSPRTPRRHHAGAGHELTPVAEPGETPHTGSCRSRGSPRSTNCQASTDHSIFSLTRD